MIEVLTALDQFIKEQKSTIFFKNMEIDDLKKQLEAAQQEIERLKANEK
jgi:FtsZ-binding cell division protein ZapB